MKSIDIANGLVFKALHIGKSTFNERLVCQKKIYLLQSLGSDLGYEYNWYMRGPYSPSLTSYVYSNLDLLENSDLTNFTLNANVESNIKKVNSLEGKRDTELTPPLWYELLASLLYINKNKASWNVEDDQDLYKQLIEMKPQFNTEQCEHGMKVLREEQFI